MRHSLFVLAALAATLVTVAADKRAYDWGNPTPRELLRDMATDRPDATESPITVDAGRVQVELSFVGYERDVHNPDRDGVRSDSLNLMPVNIRIGLRHDLELQVVLDNYLRTESKAPITGATERASGFGDVSLRLKRNLLGNDGGDTAVALMPFVKLPTNSGGVGNRHVEGGLILPVNFTLGGVGFAVMTELDIVRRESGGGYTVSWFNTFAYGFELTERLGAFLELASTSGQGRHALTGNGGLTYSLNPDLQLDLGLNLGLTRAAPDLAVFTGISRRF